MNAPRPAAAPTTPCPNQAQPLRDLLAQHDIRLTRQREEIYAALAATKAHPTAEELLRAVRSSHPGISLATVYNTLETFTRDEFSSDAPNAADAVWLGCETLSMSLQPWPDREGYYAQFGARGQCEMEGKLFDVSADMVSYDESQKLFTLKGEGTREAIIYYRDRAAAEPRPLPGQVIQFIPSANYVRVQGSSGFSGSQ